MIADSQLVTDELRERGGTAPRRDVLEAVAQLLGRREAGLAINLAVIGRRAAEYVQPDGRIGLRLEQERST